MPSSFTPYTSHLNQLQLNQILRNAHYAINKFQNTPIRARIAEVSWSGGRVAELLMRQ
jgi:hypothetical protein